MYRTLILSLTAAPLLFACQSTPKPPPAADTAASAEASRPADSDALANVVAGTWRTPAFVERDGARHPVETLTFFGVGQDDTVVEITPGAGWYTEILAPYLASGQGQYVGAVWDDTAPDAAPYYARLNATLREKLAERPDLYGQAELRTFDTQQPVFGPSGSADVVLTFRNAHNWVANGLADVYFRAMFDVLRSGGTLGVVDHRAKPGTTPEETAKSGYVTEAIIISIAEAAGFRLDASSEINANPNDTADHPNGVWTLPPSNRHDEADAETYRAIGESDRMTLRFIKP
ncbi:MAG TPA: methyltransferase [Myxococcaceae bacterium]|nr:methyltransferase [Myxococcaceae bacterium]